jgi:hypothetical protein
MRFGNDVEREFELFVVEHEVGHVVRGLPWPSRAPAFAQVEGVERVVALGEEVRELGLEEVVGEAVHVQHGAADRLLARRLTPDQHGRRLALAVRIGAELERVLPVTLDDVGLPVECVHCHAPILAGTTALTEDSRNCVSSTGRRRSSLTSPA